MKQTHKSRNSEVLSKICKRMIQFQASVSHHFTYSCWIKAIMEISIAYCKTLDIAHNALHLIYMYLVYMLLSTNSEKRFKDRKTIQLIPIVCCFEVPPRVILVNQGAPGCPRCISPAHLWRKGARGTQNHTLDPDVAFWKWLVAFSKQVSTVVRLLFLSPHRLPIHVSNRVHLCAICCSFSHRLSTQL